MHYVRLLKPPTITNVHGKPHLGLLFTIQTDLGDAFYPCDIGVEISLLTRRNCQELGQVFSQTHSWKATDRQVSVATPLGPWRPSSSDAVVVKLTPDCTADVLPLHQAQPGIPENARFALPPVLGLQTRPFKAFREPCPRITSRPIPNFSLSEFSIAEEAGDSIARHIWDAGVAAAVCVSLSRSSGPVRKQGGLHLMLADLARRAESDTINVLELGAGVGLLGYAIATSMINAKVVLTDLDEAEEMIEANQLQENGLKRPPTFQSLDWTEALPRNIQDLSLDLVVASDCTYNPDFSPALADIIAKLELSSPGVPVMVAAKERHPSEQVFFDKMREADFDISYHEVVISPLDHSDDGLEGAEHIDLYVFNRLST